MILSISIILLMIQLGLLIKSYKLLIKKEPKLNIGPLELETKIKKIADKYNMCHIEAYKYIMDLEYSAIYSTRNMKDLNTIRKCFKELDNFKKELYENREIYE